MWEDQVLKLKPFWKANQGDHFKFFCPNCRSENTVLIVPKMKLRHWIQIGLTTAFLTLILFDFFSFRTLVVFFPLWMFFEIKIRLGRRANLVCDFCQFDPFLYLSDRKSARRKVESHFEKVLSEKGIDLKKSVSLDQARPLNIDR